MDKKNKQMIGTLHSGTPFPVVFEIKKKKKSAKEMFIELGYKLSSKKHLEKNSFDKQFIQETSLPFHLGGIRIDFYNKSFKSYIYEKKGPATLEGVKYEPSYNELKAIEQQLKELGSNDE